MEALERSGKGKSANLQRSKRQGALAHDESDSVEDEQAEVEQEADEVEQENDEVEQDDEEVEDQDNVELAPAPRKTYARLARRSGARASVIANRKGHERRCLICRHPERDEIEDEFIQWQHPYDIGKAYEIDQRVVYRHARAVGLYARRTRNVRTALDSVLQNCYDAKVTGDTIVRAVRAYTRITDDGQWIDPPSRVIFSSGSRPAPALVAPGISAAPVLPALAPATSNASGEGSSRRSRRGPRPKRRNSKRSSNRQRRPIRK